MRKLLMAAGLLAGCDPKAAYEAAAESQMQQINTDAAAMMANIEMQVATDAVKQYAIVVENGGGAMDRCVQAGMVSAAFLQANAADRYAEWKQVEKRDCRAAGLP